MKKHALYLLFITLLCASISKAQNSQISSLLNEVKKWEGRSGIAADTNLYNLYVQLSINYQNSNLDSAIYFTNQCILKATKLKDKFKEAENTKQLGLNYFIKGDYSQALMYLNKCVTAIEAETSEIDNKKYVILKAKALSNIGNVYYKQSDYSKSLDYYFKALQLNEKLKNNKGITNNYTNIGLVYFDQTNYEKALAYFTKSLLIHEKIGNEAGQSINLCNIANVYSHQSLYAKALEIYNKAYAIDLKLNDKYGQTISLANIGVLYQREKEYTKALDYFLKILQLFKELGDGEGEAKTYVNIAESYLAQNNFVETKKYLQKANQSNSIIKSLELYSLINSCYYKFYLQTNNTAEALNSYKLFVQYRDSINNRENQKASIQKEMQYQFDKKQTSDSIKVADERKVASLKSEQEKNQRYFLYGGLVLVILFAGFMFNRFKVTQKQKTIIEKQKLEVEEQKHLVEEKQKEILDSIKYAKRIQLAHLPNENFINKKLKQLTS